MCVKKYTRACVCVKCMLLLFSLNDDFKLFLLCVYYAEIRHSARAHTHAHTHI